MLNIKAIETYSWHFQYDVSNALRGNTGVYQYTKPGEREAALNFSTKEEYLAWKAAWKATYKDLSKDSRGYKNARKQGSEPYKGSVGQDAHHAAMRLRRTAGALLLVRREGKLRSAELRAQRLATA